MSIVRDGFVGFVLTEGPCPFWRHDVCRRTSQMLEQSGALYWIHQMAQVSSFLQQTATRYDRCENTQSEVAELTGSHFGNLLYGLVARCLHGTQRHINDWVVATTREGVYPRHMLIQNSNNLC